jgi:drug/metabolite transporter (DMT)-like permease
MIGLCLIWGFQQVAIKAAAHDVSPILQISLRSAGAAALVWLLMLYRRERIELKEGSWKPGLVVGFLFGFEYLLVGEGIRFTTASHSVMFLYTAPVFAAVGLHWKLPAERLKAVQWTGIGIALAGIILTFYGRDTVSGSNMILGDSLALLGGVAWGATTVVIRTTSLSSAAATETLLFQLVGAFVILLGASIAFGQTKFNPTPLAIGSLIFQTFVISSASFLIWFSLLRKYLASRLGVLSFMTPMFGIIFGVLLLHEPLEMSFLAGSVLVVVGILLVSGYEWLNSTFRTGSN